MTGDHDFSKKGISDESLACSSKAQGVLRHSDNFNRHKRDICDAVERKDFLKLHKPKQTNLLPIFDLQNKCKFVIK